MAALGKFLESRAAGSEKPSLFGQPDCWSQYSRLTSLPWR